MAAAEASATWRPHGSCSRRGASKLDAAVARAEARDALVGLGWRPAIAGGAVAAACERVGIGAPLEMLIREALRCCPTGATQIA